MEDLWSICGTSCAIVQLAYFSPVTTQNWWDYPRQLPPVLCSSQKANLQCYLGIQEIASKSRLESLRSINNFIKASQKQNILQTRNSGVWSDKLIVTAEMPAQITHSSIL